MIQRFIQSAGVAALVAISLFAVGCQSDQQDPYYRVPNAKLFTLTDESEGRTIQVAPGQHFNVNLFTNPYTGYHWAYKPATKPIVDQVGTPTFIQLRDDKTQPKYGMSNFEFVATQKGSQDLKLVYYRPTLRSRQDEKYLVIHLQVVELPSTQPTGATLFVVPPRGQSVESYQKESQSGESDSKPQPSGPTPTTAKAPAPTAQETKKPEPAPTPAPAVQETKKPEPEPAPAPAPAAEEPKKTEAAPAPATGKKKPNLTTAGEGM